MADPLIVTLAEFCAQPGLPSEPVMRKLIRENPDFPATIGANGVPYGIDLAAGIAWIKERDAKRIEAQRQRAEEVRQQALDLLGEDAATNLGQEGLSIDERRKLLEEEFFRLKVAEKRGELIRKADIETAIVDVLATDAKRRREFMVRLAKLVNLSREQIAAAEELIEHDCRQFAAALKGLTETEDADAAGGGAAAV